MVAARGVLSATSHPDSNMQDDAYQETHKTLELKEVRNNNNMENEGEGTESINKSKLVNAESASGGGGGKDDPVNRAPCPKDGSTSW